MEPLYNVNKLDPRLNKYWARQANSVCKYLASRDVNIEVKLPKMVDGPGARCILTCPKCGYEIYTVQFDHGNTATVKELLNCFTVEIDKHVCPPELVDIYKANFR